MPQLLQVPEGGGPASLGPPPPRGRGSPGRDRGQPTRGHLGDRLSRGRTLRGGRALREQGLSPRHHPGVTCLWTYRAVPCRAASRRRTPTPTSTLLHLSHVDKRRFRFNLFVGVLTLEDKSCVVKDVTIPLIVTPQDINSDGQLRRGSSSPRTRVDWSRTWPLSSLFSPS